MFLFLALAGSGCGSKNDGPERFELSGKVTFGGEPVPYGSIVFTPDSSQNNKGPQGAATIRDGEYNTADEGRGIVGGPHKVIITGLNKPEGKLTDENPLQPLFPEYETIVTFPKESSTRDFEIPAADGIGP